MPRKTSQSAARRPGPGRAAGGTPADRLIRAWLDGDDDAFDALAEEFIADGRDGVLGAAVRKYAERYDEDAVADLAAALTEVAERAEGHPGIGPAQLLLLPVVIGRGRPDPQRLTGSLAKSGALPPEAGLAFAEGWRSAEAVVALPPAALRRVLLDVAAGRPPADLPAVPPGEGEVLVLVGAVTFGTGPAPDLEADPAGQAAMAETQARAQAEAFERWRASLDADIADGALILALCAPSELPDMLDALLDAAGDAEPELAEVVDFVGTAVEEARGAEVLARLVELPDGLEVTLRTRAGLELDRRVFGTEDGLTIGALRQAIGDLVPVIEDEA